MCKVRNPISHSSNPRRPGRAGRHIDDASFTGLSEDGAQTIAAFLADDPRVAHVAYPGLPSDPQHDRAAAQFNGHYGGVVSFAIARQHEDRVRFVNDLRLITSAVSLGHDETLIAYEQYPEAQTAAFASPFRDHGLIRLAVGLESAEDLLADLDAALTTAYGPHR